MILLVSEDGNLGKEESRGCLRDPMALTADDRRWSVDIAASSVWSWAYLVRVPFPRFPVAADPPLQVGCQSRDVHEGLFQCLYCVCMCAEDVPEKGEGKQAPTYRDEVRRG
jgi:hypothetical protein